MLKLDAPTQLRTRRQCDYCPARKTGLCSAFTDNGDAALADLEAAHLPLRKLDPGDIIFNQGDPADHMFHVIAGWAEMHQDMPDGRRQITGFLLAGELFGIEPRGVRRLQGATAITTALVCAIPTANVVEMRNLHPAFNERYVALLEADHRVATEFMTMLGKGRSLERVARVLWGLAKKLSVGGEVVADAAVKAPLTQRLLADATGLTTIHVNRVLRRLREENLLEFREGILRIKSPRKLAVLANEIDEPALRVALAPIAERGSPSGQQRARNGAADSIGQIEA